MGAEGSKPPIRSSAILPTNQEPMAIEGLWILRGPCDMIACLASSLWSGGQATSRWNEMECGRQISKQRFEIANMRTLVLGAPIERCVGWLVALFEGIGPRFTHWMSGHTPQPNFGIKKQ